MHVTHRNTERKLPPIALLSVLYLGHCRLADETGASRPLFVLAVVASIAVMVAVVWYEFVNIPVRLLYLAGFVLAAVSLEVLLRRIGRAWIGSRGDEVAATAKSQTTDY